MVVGKRRLLQLAHAPGGGEDTMDMLLSRKRALDSRSWLTGRGGLTSRRYARRIQSHHRFTDKDGLIQYPA